MDNELPNNFDELFDFMISNIGMPMSEKFVSGVIGIIKEMQNQRDYVIEKYLNLRDQDMTDFLHTIKTSGNKAIPHETQLQIKLGSNPGTVDVKIKLPGQKEFSDLGELPVKNGVLELPVKLVFLSYAREDQTRVKEISEALSQDGFLTWWDVKDLIPGDDWKSTIQEAIEKSDFAVLFFSEVSCTKIGYIQKEFKYIREQSELRPTNKRFIVPVLIEPCSPPREFSPFHWLKLWEDGAYEKLKQALS